MSYEAGGARRSRWLVPLVAAATVVGLTLSGLSVAAIWRLPAHPATVAATPAGARSATPGKQSIEAAETAILQRRGSAVLRHDESQFLADLDPLAPGL